MTGRRRSIGPPASPRVLQVITDRRRRGAQVFAVELHAALERRGWPVRTVALHDGGGRLDVPVLGAAATHPATLWRLREEIRSADVVVGHGSTTLPTCALASLGTGVPFVYRQVSDSLYWADTPARRARVRAGLRRATSVVALWDGAARVLTEHFAVPASRMSVVPNGVAATRFRPVDVDRRARARARFLLPADARVVAYLGALAPEKNVGQVVDAVHACAGTHLLVVGDGPERSSLEADARRLLGDRARFVGWVDDATPALAAADVVVLFSHSESMPAVLIEASLCAVPCVASRVGGVPDVVVDGRTGVLVTAGDVPALTRALEALLADPDHRAAMGASARRHALARFDIDAVASAWEAVLASAVADAGGAVARPDVAHHAGQIEW